MAQTRYKKSIETQERILDVAEELFAKQGYEVTTTRQITAAAQVRNAGVNYFFETKQELAVAVVDRRFDLLLRAREKKLAAINYASGGDQAKLRQIVEAFVLPLASFTQSGSRGWSNYNRIMYQIAISGEWRTDSYAEKVEGVARRFIASLGRVFPEAKASDLVQAYQFMLGTVLFSFAGDTRFSDMSRGQLAPNQVSIDPTPLVTFLVAGLAQLFAQPSVLAGEKAAANYSISTCK